MQVDEKGLQAAMDAFEPLSSVLRYRGHNSKGESNWHACDRMALRAAIEAYLSARSAEPVAGERARIQRFAQAALDASKDDRGDLNEGYRLAMSSVLKALDGFAEIDAKLASIRKESGE